MREYIAGPENALLLAAIDDFLSPTATTYNPLVFVGPPGAGKSHLARGIAFDWLRRRPGAVVTCIDAVDFAREFALAVETLSTAAFRSRYRGCELLVVEDVAQLEDRSLAQQELVLTVDALMNSGARVVLTAPAAPAEMCFLSAPLRSRLSGGLVVPIALPHLQARSEMLRALSAERHLNITDAAISRLAESLEVALPELDGALMFLQTSAGGEDPIDVPQVAQYLSSRDQRQQPTVRSIAAHTAKYFALKVADLRSASRSRTIATARNLAMFLARELTADSLVQIGGYFGGRDHATVLHGCRRAEKLLQTDQQMQQAATRLRQLLHPA